MTKTKAPMFLAALLLPFAAYADKNYHLANPGMCNKTDKPVRISYSSDGASDFKPNGITKERAGQKLDPGKCATLSFKVAGSPAGKVVDTGSTVVGVTFYVEDGKLDMAFDGDAHKINRGKEHHPTGLAIHSSSGHHEHFHIEIRKRTGTPGRDDKGDGGKGGGGSDGGDGGGGGEEAKKAPQPKK